MPWKECNPMDERLRFVARLLDGEKMAVMCGLQRSVLVGEQEVLLSTHDHGLPVAVSVGL